MRYEDLILRLRCRLDFLSTTMSHAGDDASEKTDDYWWGVSYVLDDLSEQVAILESAPWPLHTWDIGDDADAFLADVGRQQKARGVR